MASPQTLLLNWLVTLPFFGAAAAALFPRFRIPPHSPKEAERLALVPCHLAALISALGVSISMPLLAVSLGGGAAGADYLWTWDLYHLRLRVDALAGGAALLTHAVALLFFLHLGATWPRADWGRELHRTVALALAAAGLVVAVAAAADVIFLAFALGLALIALTLLVAEGTGPGRGPRWSGAHLAWLAVVMAAVQMWRQAGDASLDQLHLLMLTKSPLALRTAGALAVVGLAPLAGGRLGYGRWREAVRRAPVLVALSCVLLGIAGACAVIRLGPGALVLPALPAVGRVSLWLGMGMLWLGALAAWRAEDLRGRAAWFALAGAGHLLLALALASWPTAPSLPLRAAAVHLLAWPLAVAAVWLAALTVAHRARADTLAGLSGLISRTPAAGLGFLAGGLSLAGAPPLPGFREQWLLFSALWQGEAWLWLALLLAADGVIVLGTIGAFWRVFLRDRPPRNLRPSSLGAELGLVVLIMALVGAGLWPGGWGHWVEAVHGQVLTLRTARWP